MGIIALKHNFISGDQLKYALSLQQKELKSGKKTTLPDVLTQTGMVSEKKMAELRRLAKNYLEKRHATAPSPFSLTISRDKTQAEISLKERLPQSTTTGTIKAFLEKQGVIYGIVNDYLIHEFIQTSGNHSCSMVVARGRAPYKGKKASVKFRFNKEHYREEEGPGGKKKRPVTENGELLVEKNTAIQPVPGIDIFGNPIEVEGLKGSALRCGPGTESHEGGRKLFATREGTPMVSVEGIVSVFSDASFFDDIGLKSGPMEEGTNIETTGAVTGEYPLKGGSLSAREIRGADIHLVGSLDAAMGITGSTIRTQGNIRAKYIRNSTIETYGSVIVENEIMDSQITACGVVKSRNSKIVASTIKAGKGVYAVGIGTRSSEPCRIDIGTPALISGSIGKIDNKKSELLSNIEKLESFSADLKVKKKETECKIKELVRYHRQTDPAIKTIKAKILHLKTKNRVETIRQAEKMLETLVAKNSSALRALKKLSDDRKKNELETATLPREITRLEAEVEELKKNREAILDWAENLQYRCVLDVSGELTAGTLVSSPNASLEIETGLISVAISEEPSKNPKKAPGFLKIKPLKGV